MRPLRDGLVRDGQLGDGLLRDGLLTAAGAAATTLVWRALQTRRDHPSAARWERTNHAGASVTLLEGVALVAGTAGTALVTGGAWGTTAIPTAIPTAVASLGAGSLGALDDLRQDTDRKGLAGHLRALAHRRVTTGAIKIIGLAGTGLVAVTLQDRHDGGAGGPVARGSVASGSVAGGSVASAVCGTLVGGAVVAGAANLANLFDLRPGRALKVGVLTGVPLVLTGAGSPGAAVALGSSLALLPDDLAGRSMLGDTGANPLGAVLGLALVQRQGLAARTASLAVVCALTLASERVSFTKVIEATPLLRELDALGRSRAAEPPVGA
ncbi:hypothetical protein NF556_12030 [Ornithinimicrobium faecis]|uniref:Glycosyl transferase family 4 n=1 Tax=Ornithinimicrobium faecis TaxID=2934158 RepID=A0ABY4YNR7_9MICO|nr:hypothetical protein [Ornithinimicrobium sp. HY1793]USQ78376.1 hypothetical protein NF556_12030 [Ornithinimicrobium sp. HY1793]